MYDWRAWRMRLLSIALCLAAQSAAAINVQINYTYDTGNFFGSGNPQGATAGAQAKAALEAAASFYSTILTDSFSVIQTPSQFHSSQFDGQVTWHWTENFNNPTTNSAVVVTDATIAANQYVIYAGARSLSGSEAGFGGPGGFSWSSNPTGSFSQSEIDQINATTATFQNEVEHRGQATGFSRWGGTVTFDNDGTTPWFFNYLVTPSGNVTDFYSVAIHELGHSLGIGTATEWQALVSGSVFVGANAEAQNGGNPVPLSADLAHWANGTTSVVYGTATSQEAAMDPDLQNGTRKKLTALDAAGLQDIGWSLGPAPGVNGDYNNNGVVDAGDYVIWRKRLNQNVTLPNDTTPGTVTAADYTVWRASFGNVALGSGSGSLVATGEVPEPATVLFALMSGLIAASMRSTFRR
jgi:hypothetical protein